MNLQSIIHFGLWTFALPSHGAALSKRQSISSIEGSFYAYGEDIAGLPIIYVDEKAYVGLDSPPDATVATNVTFHDDSDDALTVTANSTEELPATTFFIDTNPGAFQVAGFVSTANSTPELTTSNFRVFGNELVWLTPAGELQQQWWAVRTDVENVYELRWKVDAETEADAVPVNVKNVPPVVVGDS